VPVTLVCEEAHRYVPNNPALGFEPCKRAIAKIAKEGRKYGASLCIVTQRPAEIDPTILSQCNTVFALRMSNDRDQEIVQSAVSDTGSGMLEFLPALGQREAIAFGDGVALPVRIKFDELPKTALPRSSTARFSERWQASVGDEGFLEQIVERWRSAGTGSGGDTTQQVALFAEAMGLTPSSPADQAAPRVEPALSQGWRSAPDERPVLRPREPGEAAAVRQAAPVQRRPSASPQRREIAEDEAAPSAEAPTGDNALRQLRDRLMQRSSPSR
jgi:hypothetical protein